MVEYALCFSVLYGNFFDFVVVVVSLLFLLCRSVSGG